METVCLVKLGTTGIDFRSTQLLKRLYNIIDYVHSTPKARLTLLLRPPSTTHPNVQDEPALQWSP